MAGRDYNWLAYYVEGRTMDDTIREILEFLVIEWTANATQSMSTSSPDFFGQGAAMGYTSAAGMLQDLLNGTLTSADFDHVDATNAFQKN